MPVGYGGPAEIDAQSRCEPRREVSVVADRADIGARAVVAVRSVVAARIADGGDQPCRRAVHTARDPVPSSIAIDNAEVVDQPIRSQHAPAVVQKQIAIEALLDSLSKYRPPF